MRVIAGRLRGRKLAAPEGMQTRPITDRVKESLFNILGSRFGLPGTLPEIDVLDLFAGSGGLGIEAISRGARSCLFVEHDRRSLRVLRANLAHVGVESICRVSGESAWSMRWLATTRYGLVFMDPPYREAADLLRVADLAERVAPHLADDGVIVFRHELESRFPETALRTLCCLDERALGTMRLWLLGHTPGDVTPSAD